MALDPIQVAEQYKTAIEAAEKLQSLRERELKTLEAQEELQRKIKEFIREETTIKDQTLAIEQKLEEISALRLKYQEETKNNNTTLATQTKNLLDQKIENLNNLKETLNADKQRVKVFEQQIAAITKVGQALKKSFEDGENAAKKLFGVSGSFFDQFKGKSAEEVGAFFEGFAKQAMTAEAALGALNKGFKQLADQARKVSSALIDGFNIPLLGVRINGLRDMITQVIEAPAEAFKQYGFLDQYAGSIDTMRESLRKFNISEKEAFVAVGELNQNIAAFSSYNTELQNELINTTTKLNLAGISVKSQVASFNALTTIFKQSATTANETNIKLAALSKTLGDGGKSLDDFVNLSPKLATFGTKAVEIFNETAFAAKKLGLSTQELYSIVEKYDTFEKAADAAGEFNLFLGGQFVDSIELMRASIEEGPVPVLKMLQDAVKQSGKDIATLGPAFVKYGADAAKMDPAMFKKIFQQGSEGVEQYIKDQEAAQKRQEDLNLIAEKTQNIFTEIQGAFAQAFAKKENVDALKSFVNQVGNLAKYFASMLNYLPTILKIVGSIFAVSQILSFITGLGQLTNVVLGLARAYQAGAVSKAVLIGLSGVGLGLVAAAVAAGAGAYYAIDKMFPSGAAEGGGPPTVSSLTSSGEGGSAPAGVEKLSVGDTSLSGANMTMMVGSTAITPSRNDTVVAAQPGGILATLMQEQKELLQEIANKVNKPPVVTMNGRKVSEEITFSNQYNPFVGNS